MFKGLFRERRRAVAVHGLSVPGAPNDPDFLRYVEGAATAFGAPVAAVSLIRGDRQMVLASQGIGVDCVPRGDGFCTHTLDRRGVLECCDPLVDERFATLPCVVGETSIRYYIGAPLQLLNGIDVGAICVVDTVSRQPASSDQKAYLLGLARQASMALEARRDMWDAAA